MFDRLERKNTSLPLIRKSGPSKKGETLDEVARRLMAEDRERKERKRNLLLREQYMYAKIRKENSKLAIHAWPTPRQRERLETPLASPTYREGIYESIYDLVVDEKKNSRRISRAFRPRRVCYDSEVRSTTHPNRTIWTQTLGLQPDRFRRLLERRFQWQLAARYSLVRGNLVSREHVVPANKPGNRRRKRKNSEPVSNLCAHNDERPGLSDEKSLDLNN